MENQRAPFFLKSIFQGRLGRKNFFVAHLMIYLLPSIIAGVVWLAGSEIDTMFITLSILTLIGLALSLPLTVRRIHDMGYSSWLLIIAFVVPLFGPIGAIILFLLVLWIIFGSGNKIINKYGPPEDENRGFFSSVLNR